MQGHLWNGIKRDRLVWLDDFHPELKTTAKGFGNNEAVPNSLDLVCEQYPLPDLCKQNADLGFLKKHR